MPGASALSTVKNSVSGTVARSVFVQAACISSAIVPIVDRVAAEFVRARIRSRALIGCARSAQLRTIAVTKTCVHVLDHSDVELAGSAMSLLRPRICCMEFVDSIVQNALRQCGLSIAS